MFPSPPIRTHAPSGHTIWPAGHRASQKPVVTHTSVSLQVMILGQVGVQTPLTQM